MPAISGKKYLARKAQLKPNVSIKGEKIIGKISDHPVDKGYPREEYMNQVEDFLDTNKEAK